MSENSQNHEELKKTVEELKETIEELKKIKKKGDAKREFVFTLVSFFTGYYLDTITNFLVGLFSR